MKRIIEIVRDVLRLDRSKITRTGFTEGGFTGSGNGFGQRLVGDFDKMLRPGEYFIESNSPAQEGKPGSVA